MVFRELKEDMNIFEMGTENVVAAFCCCSSVFSCSCG